jgi:hypothetical protein
MLAGCASLQGNATRENERKGHILTLIYNLRTKLAEEEPMKRVATLGLALAVVSCSNGGGGSSIAPSVANTVDAQQQPISTARTSDVDTDFSVKGRYIDFSKASLKSAGTDRPDATVPFFVKGMVYSPAPIGLTVGDPPLLDDALRDADEPIWSRDLPLMRAMGVNAIHVYNVVPPPYDAKTGPITNFLNAAWNNGDHPVYVIMSVYFQGSALLNSGAVSALANQYHDLDAKYAKYPAVMGTSISNEIGAIDFINNPTWWQNFNIVARAAKKGFVDGGDGSKIVTTSEADGNIGAVQKGEQNGAAVDVWGVNIYRGRTFTNLYDQIKQYTTKPVLLTEYGASAAYHTGLTNTYSWVNTPTGLGQCTPTTPAGTLTADNVAELPATGNPDMAGLIDLVQNNAQLLYSGYKDQGGIVSGGFYFEWTDEWWKANNGNPSVHSGNTAFNGHYPGCTEDQGWYGLNQVSKGGGSVDALTPRPTLKALQDTWGAEP